MLKFSSSSLRRGRAWSLALSICAGVCALASVPAQAEAPQLDLPRTELRVGMFRIDAQVAARFYERQTGLMYRDSMPAHEGMLFVFEQAGVQCFWMKNTRIPLTAAFVDDDGTIVNLADMQPHDERSHCSAKPVRFVLEMNQGWFANKGIRAGSRMQGPVFASAAR
ncbi:MAG: DUF192 domain-containing protein [Comamonas sp.]